MSLFNTLGRIPKLLEANLNDLLDNIEDPVKMMNQLITEAKQDLADLKRSLGECMAREEAAKDAVAECQRDIDKYMDAARGAAKSGDEAAAKQLLQKKISYENKMVKLKENLELHSANVSELRTSYDEMCNKIQELEERRDVTVGKNSAAKGQEIVAKASKSAKSSKALDAFDRYEDKVDQRLRTAKAMSKLDESGDATDDLLAKYGNGGSAAVDDEYVKLMASLQ